MFCTFRIFLPFGNAGRDEYSEVFRVKGGLGVILERRHGVGDAVGDRLPFAPRRQYLQPEQIAEAAAVNFKGPHFGHQPERSIYTATIRRIRIPLDLVSPRTELHLLKRPAPVSKETLYRQKRPNIQAKETEYTGKRDLFERFKAAA